MSANPALKMWDASISRSLSTTCHRLVYSANKKIKSAVVVVSRPRLVCVETSIDASQSHLFLYADICEYVAAVNIRNTAHLTLNNIQSIDADI
jgi:hypothetical protein